MTRTEKTIVFVAIGNMLIYVPVFAGCMFSDPSALATGLIVWHFAGMILNVAAVIATVRDLYRRTFPNPSSKVTWCLLILFTGGIGWLVYIFKHALKPIPEQRVCEHCPNTG